MNSWLSGKSIAQVICWDRGRPARNEREARKLDCNSDVKNLRACGAFAGGTPAVPDNHLSPGREVV
jgi:hypothetical protein